MSTKRILWVSVVVAFVGMIVHTAIMFFFNTLLHAIDFSALLDPVAMKELIAIVIEKCRDFFLIGALIAVFTFIVFLVCAVRVTIKTRGRISGAQSM